MNMRVGSPGGDVPRRRAPPTWPASPRYVAASPVQGTGIAPRKLPTHSPEDYMAILTWIIVGLVAGVLASLVMGGTGYGLIGDIIIGIVGAFVGGWLLRTLGTGSPFSG